ncbi:hypothetical protein BJ508DRAFT_300668 [Ascobolus immersus RN42]|uniref:Uncharacterized protein n=1 Tax=Ascobolus immersus RN42 TaxID=1160509 RepID=A0A3N4J0G0_ASCIM|nr:hypothetical protein BJ508DRAFT_300668 [Ascobolus immersus RN42]
MVQSDPMDQPKQKRYISSQTQTPGSVINCGPSYLGEPLDVVVIREDSTDWEWAESKRDYFEKDEASCTEEERRVRLDLLIRTGSLFAEYKLLKLNEKGVTKRKKKQQVTEGDMKILVKAYAELFSTKTRYGEIDQDGIGLMMRIRDDGIDIYALDDFIPSKRRSDYEAVCCGIKDDYGDRFEAPKVQRIAELPRKINIENCCQELLQGATTGGEAAKVRDEAQKYFLLYQLEEVTISFQDIPSFCSSTFSTVALGANFREPDGLSEQPNLLVFDETELKPAMDICEIDLPFNQLNFVVLDARSIGIFHVFMIRLRELIARNLVLLEPRRRFNPLRDPITYSRDSDCSRFLPHWTKLLSNTQVCLKALASIINHSRAFQIYLSQQEVARCLKTGIEEFRALIGKVTKKFDALDLLFERLNAPLSVTLIEAPLCKPKQHARLDNLLGHLTGITEWEDKRLLESLVVSRDSGSDRPYGYSRHRHEDDVGKEFRLYGHGFGSAKTNYHSEAMLACLRTLKDSDIDPLPLSASEKQSFKSICNELRACDPLIVTARDNACKMCHIYLAHLPSSPDRPKLQPMSESVTMFAVPPWEVRESVLYGLLDVVLEPVFYHLVGKNIPMSVEDLELYKQIEKKKKDKENMKKLEKWMRETELVPSDGNGAELGWERLTVGSDSLSSNESESL